MESDVPKKRNQKEKNDVKIKIEKKKHPKSRPMIKKNRVNIMNVLCIKRLN